jgi:hypothetical protein
MFRSKKSHPINGDSVKEEDSIEFTVPPSVTDHQRFTLFMEITVIHGVRFAQQNPAGTTIRVTLEEGLGTGARLQVQSEIASHLERCKLAARNQ